jgi:hypothetical protein
MEAFFAGLGLASFFAFAGAAFAGAASVLAGAAGGGVPAAGGGVPGAGAAFSSAAITGPINNAIAAINNRYFFIGMSSFSYDYAVSGSDVNFVTRFQNLEFLSNGVTKFQDMAMGGERGVPKE